TLAQLVERLIRNQQVAGSIPAGGSRNFFSISSELQALLAPLRKQYFRECAQLLLLCPIASLEWMLQYADCVRQPGIPILEWYWLAAPRESQVPAEMTVCAIAN